MAGMDIFFVGSHLPGVRSAGGLGISVRVEDVCRLAVRFPVSCSCRDGVSPLLRSVRGTTSSDHPARLLPSFGLRSRAPTPVLLRAYFSYSEGRGIFHEGTTVSGWTSSAGNDAVRGLSRSTRDSRVCRMRRCIRVSGLPCLAAAFGSIPNGSPPGSGSSSSTSSGFFGIPNPKLAFGFNPNGCSASSTRLPLLLCRPSISSSSAKMATGSASALVDSTRPSRCARHANTFFGTLDFRNGG